MNIWGTHNSCAVSAAVRLPQGWPPCCLMAGWWLFYEYLMGRGRGRIGCSNQSLWDIVISRCFIDALGWLSSVTRRQRGPLNFEGANGPPWTGGAHSRTRTRWIKIALYPDKTCNGRKMWNTPRDALVRPRWLFIFGMNGDCAKWQWFGVCSGRNMFKLHLHKPNVYSNAHSSILETKYSVTKIRKFPTIKVV